MRGRLSDMTISRRLLTASATALVVLCAAAGYLVGSSQAPDDADATQTRSEARIEAQKTASDRAYRRSFARGLATGRTDGRQAGAKEGAAAGERAGSRKVERRLAAIEAQEQAEAAAAAAAAEAAEVEAPDCSDPTALPTPPGCPVPWDGPCGLYAELQPDGTCGAKTPDSATPAECPPGYVPAGIYGACAPGKVAG